MPVAEVMPKPERLATRRPRGRRGSQLFNDENLDLLSHVLDDWFQIPGTSIRFGIDGIVGLIPGVGDLLGGLASCIIVLAAWFRGAPAITVARMVANIAVEVFVGAIPFFGDVFDIAWKANRRNYKLLSGSLAAKPRSTAQDWLFFGVIGLAVLALSMIPFLLMAWLISKLVLAGMHTGT
jgi:Domain of unknown function (DUF4112)